MRIQFILEFYVHRHRLQKNNLKRAEATCFEVMCHYRFVDYCHCHDVTCNRLNGKNSKYTIHNI